MRSRDDRVIGGVIGGLAEYFDVSSFWMRAIAVGLQFTVAPWLFLAYLGALIIMPRRRRQQLPPIPVPPGSAVDESSMEPKPARKPSVSLDAVAAQFDVIEDKVRQLEDYVTSREYALNRKFENL